MSAVGTRAWPCAAELDPFDIFDARRRLAELEPQLDVAELDDDTVRARLRDHDEHAHDREQRERRTYEVQPWQRDRFDETVELQSLIERHRLAFLVLDGRGEPFTGVPYELFESGRSNERTTVGSDGMVRRDAVTHDDFTLVLVDIEEVRWVAGGKGAGTHAIEIACSGIGDGTRLELRVFEELREVDDEAIATLDATVSADRAHASWTIAPERLAELAGDDGRVTFVVEARGPQGRWRKSDEQLELAAPTIVAVAIGPAPRIDTPLELVLRTRGVEDGTAVILELWHAHLGAAPERIATIDGVTVQGEYTRVPWTLAPPDDDPLRIHGGECWLRAQLDVPGAPAVASALVFVAPA